MNSENESFPIGRIVSMWEQAKKKRITIEWLYQSEDVERACEKQLSGDHEEYETGASEPPAKVLCLFHSAYDFPRDANLTKRGQEVKRWQREKQ